MNDNDRNATSGAGDDKTSSAMRRLKRGEKLVMAGTLVAVMGIVAYCTTIFLGDIQQEPVNNHGECLIIIAAGLVIWATGAIKYLNAAIDTDAVDDSL